MASVAETVIVVKAGKGDKWPADLPPLKDEPNQAEIDKAQAEELRKGIKPKSALADANDLAFEWGAEDATDGADQRGGRWFPISSPAWHAYNAGYAEGCIQLAVLTGVSRSYWLPAADVSWNGAPALVLEEDVNYVPFQNPELYRDDILPEWQRDDWIGA